MITKNNTLKYFYIFLTLFLCIFVFVLPYKILSAEPGLELEYPQSITGSTITGQSDLAQYLKYIFDVSLSVGISIAFLTLVISSIFYFIAPVSPNAMGVARDRISGSISGLLILLLTYLIITTINPYLSIFRISPLEKVEITVPEDSNPGVLLYKSKDCSNSNAIYNTNVSDLGELKNKINSVQISQDKNNNIYYISILYDNINFWGACQYISPNKGCQGVNVSVASASVYAYDFNPSGDGVYIYRKSYNSVEGKEENKDGGYLKIKNSEIKTSAGKNLYFKKLSDLYFTGDGKTCTVPKEERDCSKWNEAGRCKDYKCPSLSNENISSIDIKGNYLIVLIYVDPNDRNLTYTYCQAFPTKYDYNKIGPQQIKWDPIMSSGYKPTHMLIIPVKP